MKKPTKPPPPPPPPPRSRSPAGSCCSLPRQIGSEYAESVFSTRSLQQPPCCQGCCTVRRTYAASCCDGQSSPGYAGFMTATKPSRPPPPPPLSQQQFPQKQYQQSPRTPQHQQLQQPSTPLANSQQPLLQPQQQIVNGLPPTPKERMSRPRLSISPMPILKNNTDPSNGPRFHDKCKSLHYRRHMEQHVERVFKYLNEREERRLECEADLSSTKADLSPTKCQQNANTILTILAKKESQYLRSRRRRLRKSDFEEIQKLGSGFIGNVVLVKKIPFDNKFDGKPALFDSKPALFAMKKLKKIQVQQQGHMAHVMAERDILAEADNEWIVKLYYSFQDDTHLYFILEYIPGGDMMNLLYEQNVFPEDWARFYIAEVSLALQLVHNMGYIHRDIKPDNILIDARGHIKLTDFGLCTGFRWTHDLSYYKDDTLNTMVHSDNTAYDGTNNNFDDHPTITKALTKREIEHSSRPKTLSLVGSPNYIAPEVLRQAFCRQSRTNEKLCDWWSVGVILYEMVIGYCPFIDLQMLNNGNYHPKFDPPSAIQLRILNWKDHLAFPSRTTGPPFMQDKSGYEHNISNETKALIRGLLCDPHERLCQNGISDIQNHPFFRGIDWRNIRSTQAPYVPELKDEFDTRHFEQFSQLSEPENVMGSGTATKMPMNDFTYRCFWSKLPK